MLTVRVGMGWVRDSNVGGAKGKYEDFVLRNMASTDLWLRSSGVLRILKTIPGPSYLAKKLGSGLSPNVAIAIKVCGKWKNWCLEFEGTVTWPWLRWPDLPLSAFECPRFGGKGYLVDPWLAAVSLKQGRPPRWGSLHVRVHAHPTSLVLKLIDGKLAHQPSQQACIPSQNCALFDVPES